MQSFKQTSKPMTYAQQPSQNLTYPVELNPNSLPLTSLFPIPGLLSGCFSLPSSSVSTFFSPVIKCSYLLLLWSSREKLYDLSGLIGPSGCFERDSECACL